MSHPRRDHRLAVAGAALVTVLWSSSWVLIRVGLDDQDLPPLTFAGLRYGAAAIVLTAWSATVPRHRRQVALLDRRSVRRLLVLGVVFYAVTQGAQFVAIDNQPAATTSLVLALTPLLVAISAARSLDEPASPRQVGGGLLVAAGAWLYFSGNLGATTVGIAASLVGLGANVASALLGRSVNREHALSPVVVTSVSMATGAALLLVTGLLVEGRPHITAEAALIVVWLAVVNTAFAFTLWNLSLRRLSAVESAGINNTMLIQIALLAWVFLDEPPGVLGTVGIVVVSVGVFFTQSFQPGSARRAGPRR